MSDQSVQDALNRWSGLVKRTLSDPALKRRLMEDPALVLKENGLQVRPGLEVRVVENTDKVAYLTLPAKAAQGELSMDQLDGIVGGQGARRYLEIRMDQVFITSVVSA